MTFKIAILAEDSSLKLADFRKCEKCATFVRQMKFNQHPESTNSFTEGFPTCLLPASADYTVLSSHVTRDCNRSEAGSLPSQDTSTR